MENERGKIIATQQPAFSYGRSFVEEHPLLSLIIFLVPSSISVALLTDVMGSERGWWVTPLLIVMWLTVGYLAALIPEASLRLGRRVAYAMRRCPEGIIGGATRERCPVCKERHDLWESQKAERQKDAEIEYLRGRVLQGYAKRAKELRQDEIERLASANSQRIEFLRAMHWQQFEDYTATLFRAMGYDVTQTGYTNDGGKDAIARKDGKIYVIECKKYGPKTVVGRPDIQKFFAAREEAEASIGFFVTTNRFSPQAAEYAKKVGIQLIGPRELVDLIRLYLPGNGDAKTYQRICEECGAPATLSLDDNATMKCSNGHIVIANIIWDDVQQYNGSPVKNSSPYKYRRRRY